MQDFDKTTRITNSPSAMGLMSNLLVTIFDGDAQPKTIRLDDFGNTVDSVLRTVSGQSKIRRCMAIDRAKTV